MTNNIQLSQDQALILDRMLNNNFFGVAMPVGTGKTLTTLLALMLLRPSGQVLIIAPKNITRSTWIDEIEKWGFEINTKSLVIGPRGGTNSAAKRNRLLDEAADPATPPTLWFLNEDTIDKAVIHYTQQNKKTKAKYKPAVWPFSTVVIDESQGFKNPKAEKFKALRSTLPFITRMYLLSGTPDPQGVIDMWAQAFLLDRGQSLGENFFNFRDQYFYSTFTTPTGHPAGWTEKDGAREEIWNRLKPIYASVKNTRFHPAPLPVNDIKIHLEPEVMDRYREFVKNKYMDMITELGDSVSVLPKHEAALAIKLTQFAAGTLYVPPSICRICQEHVRFEIVIEEVPGMVHQDPALDDDHPVIAGRGPNGTCCGHCKEPIKPGVIQNPVSIPHHLDEEHETHPVKLVSQHDSYEIIHEAKLEMTDYILRNTDSPVTIPYRFVSDERHLLKRLNEMGHPTVKFDGSAEMVHAWNRQEYPVMLLQPASAGHGLNLQDGGHTVIWYTLPTSMEEYTQTNGRFDRRGQKHPVMIHRLLTAGTYDEKLPKILEGKISSHDAFMEAISVSKN